MPILDVKKLRDNYPITQNDIYLNHAATAPIAASTIARIAQINREMERPLSEHIYAWLGIIEDTRRRVAELIGADPAEIAFCQNTSTALSLIANAIPFKPGDRVLVPSNEFPSNIYIWQSLKSKGVTCELFNIESGVPIVKTLQQLNLQNVRLISISAVSFLTGRLCELVEIANFCREQNILICYDAIQSIGTHAFDVSIIKPDFVASGAQKWLLGSVGCGFLYAKQSWLEKLTVPLVGWTSVKYPEDFSIKEVDFSNEMTRFEPGLPNILPIVALNQTLRDLSDIGFHHIYERIARHAQYLKRALEHQGIETLAKQDETTGIVAFALHKQIDTEFFDKHIKKHNIHITTRHNIVRVSPTFYNTETELDVFLSALKLKSPLRLRTDNTITKKEPAVKQDTYTLLTGATGILGKAFAHELAAQKRNLILVGRNGDELNTLKEKLQHQSAINIQVEQADFTDDSSLKQLFHNLKARGRIYHSLINCAGVAEAQEFLSLPAEKLETMLQVNCLAPFQLSQLFLKELHAKDALGILNIVSPTGRCGYPLLSGYAASSAALWSLGEVLARELSNQNQLSVTTYVAPPMHSRMQKRLGRQALRYFKLSGVFPYKQPHDVAKEAWRIFLKKKSLYVNPYNRLSLLMNAIAPSAINKRIKKIWKV